MQQIAAMQQQIAEMNIQLGQAKELHGHVQTMVDTGVLKVRGDGQIEAVTDPAESEYIK